jgi:hypothetical protein
MKDPSPCPKCGRPRHLRSNGYRRGKQRFKACCDPCEYPRTQEHLRAFKIRQGGAAAYRNRQRDRSPEGRKQYLARKTVENHLKIGDLIKQPCERCGNLNSHAHHENYDQPLIVVWLCPKHHKARHREMKEAARGGAAQVG